MSQLKTLSIETIQATDIKAYNGNKSTEANGKESSFSDVIDQHYQDQKRVVSDKNPNNNGNDLPKAASNTTENLTSATVEKIEEFENVEIKIKELSKGKTPKGMHILPIPLPPVIASDESKVKAGDEAHILPIPLPPIIASDESKVTAGDEAHILPIPLPPVIASDESKVKSDDEAHILPIPLPPIIASGTKTDQDNLSNLDDNDYKLNVLAQTIRQENAQTPVLDASDDQTVDLLKMLSGAQKLLTKTENNISSIDINQAAITRPKVNVEDVAHENIGEVDKTNSLTKLLENELVSNDNNSELDQRIKDDQVVANIKEIKSNNKDQINQNNENTTRIVSQVPHQLTNQGLNSSAEDTTPQKNTSAIKDELASNTHQTSVVNQAKVINQSTAEVVETSSEKFHQLSLNKSKENNIDVESIAEKINEESSLSTPRNEKLTIATDKIVSVMSQTLEAQANRPTLNSAEIALQQEQGFESTLSKLNAATVNTQKQINATNVETISIYRKDFTSSVKEKVMIMINQKIQQVEIQLDPPEMGNIHVRVNLQNEQAAVQFIVQNQQAKEALDQNMDKLRDMLSENGVDVGDANIEQRDSGEQAQAEDDHSGSREETHMSNQEHHNQVSHVVKASTIGVDYYA